MPSFTLAAAPTLGRLLVAYIFCTSGTAPTAASGWTQRSVGQGGSGGSARSGAFFTKTAGAAESATQSPVTTSLASWAGGLAEYADIDTATAPVGTGQISAAGATFTTPSATPTASIPILILTAFGVRTASSFSNQQVNAGAMTERTDLSTTNATAAISDMDLGTSAGGYTGTASPAATGSVGCSSILIYKAVPAGPGFRNLTGTSAAASSAAGVVSKIAYKNLTGTTVGTSGAAGSVTKIVPIVYKNIVGSANGSAVTISTATRRRSVTGASIGAATETGQPTAERSLVGVSAGIAAVSASLSSTRALVGTSTAASTATGVVTKIVIVRTTPLPFLAITDDFEDGVMNAQWTTVSTGTAGGVLSEAGGTLNLGYPSNTSTQSKRGYITVGTYDLTHKAIQVQVVATPFKGSGSRFVLRVETGAYYIEFGLLDANLAESFNNAGGGGQGAGIAWPAALKYIRMEFDNGTKTVYYDYSTNGTTWISARTRLWPLADVTALKVSLVAYNIVLVASPGTGQFDNFNLAFISYKNLTGSSGGSSTATSQPTRKLQITGSSAGAATDTGQTTRRRSLSGVSGSAATVSGQATRRRSLVVSAAGISSTTASVLRRRALVGASAGAAVGAGQATRKRSIVASAGGAATVSGQVSIRSSTILPVLTAGKATVAVSLTRKRAVVASSVGTAVTTVALTRKRSLIVSTAGSVVAIGVISKKPVVVNDLVGSAAGKATANATLVSVSLVLWNGSTFTLVGNYPVVLWNNTEFRIDGEGLDSVTYKQSTDQFDLVPA